MTEPTADDPFPLEALVAMPEGVGPERAGPPRALNEADAVEIWIARWLRIRRKDLMQRYGCDSGRLYEIWWGERFPASREKAADVFQQRYPGLVDRTAFGYRRIPRPPHPHPASSWACSIEGLSTAPAKPHPTGVDLMFTRAARRDPVRRQHRSAALIRHSARPNPSRVSPTGPFGRPMSRCAVLEIVFSPVRMRSLFVAEP